jgi:hypothetical protein
MFVFLLPDAPAGIPVTIAPMLRVLHAIMIRPDLLMGGFG